MSKATVYFDGDCPICRREIEFYKKHDTTACLAWKNLVDINDNELPATLSKTLAMKRFHLETEDGQVLSGASAFAFMWSSLPRFRLLGWIASRKAILPLLEWTYILFLRWRPRLQMLLLKEKR